MSITTRIPGIVTDVSATFRREHDLTPLAWPKNFVLFFGTHLTKQRQDVNLIVLSKLAVDRAGNVLNLPDSSEENEEIARIVAMLCVTMSSRAGRNSG